jgi:putative two-component system response regulator
MPHTFKNTPSLYTILVVDDTPENLAVLGDLLRPHYKVRAASSGFRALQVAATLPRPDLILLDVMMPGIDGYEVLKRIRENPETQDIPVIFVTAMDAMADEELGLELGAVDYITKPIRPAIVLARIHAHLELKHSRDVLKNHNAWLESEINRRMRENQLIQDVSMRALASLAETRDNETGNHIRRTQAYVEILGQQLASFEKFKSILNENTINLIAKAAPLHDIGKVGIPDHILLKPGKLNPEEWIIMQTHSRLGRDAIATAMRDIEDQSPLTFLHIAMRIAYSHHEKWDGSGYPEHLSGEAIPLEARLMAVADVFDALTSRRPYKKALPFDEAVRIIIAGRNSHFDPDIVDAFLARLDDFKSVAQRYID